MKTIAFVPARCGSKSIKLKNIKAFCGKPLIYWNLTALQHCPEIDEIHLATDCEDIASIAQSFNLSKVHIYRREASNAQDTSSTESVMLEFLHKKKYAPTDRFILVQVTSPFTQTQHFAEAIQQLNASEDDSLLSAVRMKRFVWHENGTPINYDYKNRPRRQDFKGLLLENGAFYINSVQNVLAHQNRLSGKISIYEMPEYTATELDEPDDWLIAEKLMYKYVIKSKPIHPEKIKLFITDVDGVLTDAGMYYTESGDELKKFNTHDGKGIELLRKAGLKTAIITSENTQLVARRAKKLKFDYVYQGIIDKLGIAKEICEKEGLSLEEIAYIGDDLGDLILLQHTGISAAPANALPYIKEQVDMVLVKKGGEGAVREFAEWLLQEKGLPIF